MSFVHLHTHSSYSPLSGIPAVEALCQAANAQGHDYVALTDTMGSMARSGFLRKLKRRE